MDERIPKLTKAQVKELRRAADHPLGIVETVCGWGGLQRASWHARMSHLVADGLLKPYVHGGYEITPAGLSALKAISNG